MLVIADQAPQWVRRKRRLTRARKPKEQRHIARRPHIRRTVHREYAARRQQVIHDGESRLLHFPGITGSANQNRPLLEADRDAGFRIRAVLARIRLKLRREHNSEVRRVVLGLLRVWPDEKLPREQAVPGKLADHPDGHAVFGVRPHMAILHIHIVPPPENQHFGIQAVEIRLRHRLVQRSPSHIGFRHRVAYRTRRNGSNRYAARPCVAVRGLSTTVEC